MADGYEPLRGGQPGFDALMQMLVNIQRQGAIEKQAAWQGLGRGIEGLGGGIGTARADTRRREFEAGQAGDERTFRSDLAATAFQNQLAEGRESDRLARLRDEDARAFAATQAATGEANLVKRQQAERLWEAGQRAAAQGSASSQAGLDRYSQFQRDLASKGEAKRRQDFAARQSMIDFNRQRGMEREKRGFEERMLTKQLGARKGAGGGALDESIVRLRTVIAEGNANGIDTSGLQQELGRMLAKRGDAVAPPAAAPAVSPPSYAAVKKTEPTTYGELVKKQKTLAEGTPELNALAADIAAKVARPAVGLNVRDTAAQSEVEAAARTANARSIAEMFTEEGEGVFDLSGRVKTAKGRVFNNAIRIMAGSWPNTPAMDDEEAIVRILGSQFPSPFGSAAGGRTGAGRGQYKPIVTEPELRDFIRYAKTLFPK